MPGTVFHQNLSYVNTLPEICKTLVAIKPLVDSIRDFQPFTFFIIKAKEVGGAVIFVYDIFCTFVWHRVYPKDHNFEYKFK